MTTRIIAIYSLKGGVGKTTLAVNLAWEAATVSKRRTLLWDLDGQAAATFILGHDVGLETVAGESIRRGLDPLKRVLKTSVQRLDLLPADSSLRDLDVIFRELDKKKRLAKLAGELGGHYDRIVIDCPPGLTDTSEQILRAADLVVIPVIPSALSRRALDAVASHVGSRKGLDSVLFPVFSMVDRRRALHRAALAETPGWPVIPMASAFEAMAQRRAPLGTFAPAKSPGVAAVAQVWASVERILTKAR